MLHRKIPWLPIPIFPSFINFKRFAALHDHDQPYTIKEVTGITEEIITSGNSTDGTYMINRNPVFLTWRYQNHPWHKYRFFCAYNGNSVVGYVILRDCIIVDICAGSADIFSLLLRNAVRYFIENKIVMVHLYLQCNTIFRDIVRNAGFIPYKLPIRIMGTFRQQNLMIRKNPKTKNTPLILDASSWYFSTGDIALGL